jgi:phenylalanine-4-hydroxylase
VKERRFHLVTIQDGREFVSSIALSEDDAESLLAVDRLLHRAAGWQVVRAPHVVVARRGNVVRLLSAQHLSADSARGERRRVA